jgi:adenylyltransferase/sulfurtransferase
MHDDQLLRYSRHLLLPQWSDEAQQRLQQAKVLAVGSGGLGNAAALYLASSGVGHLTLCDHDQVDLTNLQRQVAFRNNQVGQNKALALKDSLHSLNPSIQIEALTLRLEGEALSKQVASADLVLDCSDNFSTRHGVNRACVQHKKPLVSGAAIGFGGQIAVFDCRNSQSPCYECLFPEAGQSEEMRCAVMGVFAPLVGIVGATQAAEALKLLTGIGESLAGRFLLLEGLGMHWQELRLPQDPQCPVCQASSAR